MPGKSWFIFIILFKWLIYQWIMLYMSSHWLVSNWRFDSFNSETIVLRLQNERLKIHNFPLTRKLIPDSGDQSFIRVWVCRLVSQFDRVSIWPIKPILIHHWSIYLCSWSFYWSLSSVCWRQEISIRLIGVYALNKCVIYGLLTWMALVYWISKQSSILAFYRIYVRPHLIRQKQIVAFEKRIWSLLILRWQRMLVIFHLLFIYL